MLARVLASLTCAGLAALACVWLFRLLAFYTSARAAMLIALAFPCTTIFLAYARSAWDVLGACCLMCGVLYYSTDAMRRSSRASLILLAATLAAACSFRYSLAPFAVPAAMACVWGGKSPRDRRVLTAAAALFAALMAPSFVYNAVRTGSALRPATACTVYLETSNALTGNMVTGLFGLLLSPNRGLFVFAPVLLLAAASRSSGAGSRPNSASSWARTASPPADTSC